MTRSMVQLSLMIAVVITWPASIWWVCTLAAAENSDVHRTLPLTFERDVRPIFKTHCFHCHGESSRLEADLDLRLRKSSIKGGESGPAIVPGSVDGSYLVERLRSQEMPPGPDSPKLTEEQVATIEQWIEMGAPTARPEPDDPEDIPLITEEERSHWAFQPISSPRVPQPQAIERVRNEIDSFLLERLERAGLSYSSDADRSTLIRRASFDLLGLPPTPEEIDAFVNDRDANAYERLIERLLNSPRYGERWGRHWLDLVGYADSEGFNEADVVRDDAWAFRDYVIRAFNDDKPFDTFIQEQLAGDELALLTDSSSPNQDLLIATGFLRMAPDGTGIAADNTPAGRNAVVEETIKIVSSTLLGLTLGCAQCHDHRYDPIPQRDYYRFRAVFEPAFNTLAWKRPAERRLSLASAEDLAEINRLERIATAVEQAMVPVYNEYRDWTFNQEIAKVPPEVRAVALLWKADPTQLTEMQNTLLASYPQLKIPARYNGEGNVVRDLAGKYGRKEEYLTIYRELKARAAALRAEKPPQVFVRTLTEPRDKTPPATNVFIRGDYAQLGDVVAPGDLSVVCSKASEVIPANDPSLPTTGRRLAYARQLTSGTHPLLARVLVNRFWLHHMGRGLVATPGDFGVQGEPPSHPELLDWLASKFMTDGWRLKEFHRLLMCSTAYRLSTEQSSLGRAIDSDNRLVAHRSIRRLEAEAIRDAILSVAGNLCFEASGPPVAVVLDDFGQVIVRASNARAGELSTTSHDGFRRSVYVQVRRSMPAYILDVFDSPTMEPNCELRRESTVAQQALLMMNSEFIVDQSARFAARVRREVGSDRVSQIKRAWRLAFGSEPAEADVQDIDLYLSAPQMLATSESGTLGPGSRSDDASPVPLETLCQVLLCSNRFLYVE